MGMRAIGIPDFPISMALTNAVHSTMMIERYCMNAEITSLYHVR
jgi:hypothetical protein